jgi:hypothetical protein
LPHADISVVLESTDAATAFAALSQETPLGIGGDAGVVPRGDLSVAVSRDRAPIASLRLGKTVLDSPRPGLTWPSADAYR